MTLDEFEIGLQSIRARKGWRIVLECIGVWIIKVYDKESGKLLAETGMTGLAATLDILEIPFDETPWN